MTYEELVESLERDAARFGALVRSGDLDAPVPACPGWSVRDLALHLAGVHRWAHATILTGRPGEEPVGPPDRDPLALWFDEGAALLVDALRRTDPASPTWTFGAHPRTVAFWARRQAQETAMHLGDAQRALGAQPTSDVALAADGVDEVVTMFFPRQVRLGRTPPLRDGLRLVLTDGTQQVDGSSADFVLAGDGTDPEAAAGTTLTGPSPQLLLLLWGRLDLDAADGVSVKGDRSVVRHVLGCGLTP